MTDTLFCLDIHKDAVAALVVDDSSKITRVTGCAVTEMEGRSFEDAVADIKSQTGFDGGSCLATFGADFFSFRNVTLPFSERKKIEQALPFELEDHTPVDINSLLIDFVVAKTESKKTDIVAAMIGRELFAEYLAILNNNNISPDRIGLSGHSTALRIADQFGDDFLFIDLGTRSASLFVVQSKEVSLIRSLPILPEAEGRSWLDSIFIQNIKQTLHASQLMDTEQSGFKIYLAGSESRTESAASFLSPQLDGAEIAVFRQSAQPLIKIEPEIRGRYRPEIMDRILAHVCKNGKKRREFDFRKDDFRKKKSLEDYRELGMKIALPFLAVCVALIAYWGYTYSSLSTQQDELQQQIVEVFKETLPEVTRIVNPVQQLQVKNKEIRETFRPGGGSGASYTIIELLTEISARIPAKYRVKVIRMVADTDTVRLKAVTGDFNTVDNVQKDLKKSTYFSDVVISAANQSLQEDAVNFELKLELAR